MNVEHLARALMHDDPTEAAALIRSYVVPHVTRLTQDRIGHDLAPDAVEILRGHFMPAGEEVVIEVDAAYSFVGKARAALLMLVGQPDELGETLYDSGGAPVPGASWHSMGSVDGESAWASTTARRIVVDVDPDRPVTWQLVGTITGGAETTSVPGASRIAITPDGTQAFVTSPEHGTVTPIRLGRPGYSTDSSLTVQDVGLAPIHCGGAPQRLAADDTHVVVCDAEGAVLVLPVVSHELVHRVECGPGRPTDCAIVPGANAAIVVTASGGVCRLELPSGSVTSVEVGGHLQGVAVTADGGSAFVADTEAGQVHRLSLPDLEVRATIPVGPRPHVIRVAPDGRVWVLCAPEGEVGRVQGIDPDSDQVFVDHALPFPGPSDLAIVGVEGQSDDVVRTAWIAFEESHYCQFLIGGRFEGQPHSFHHGSFGNEGDGPASIALNEYGEIWVTQPILDRVWRWPGGRILCRADAERPHWGVFFGEYCDVSVYGARWNESSDPAATRVDHG